MPGLDLKVIEHFNKSCFSPQAQNDTELSFNKGDRLEVLDRPANDPEWYKARNQCGQIGLVPSNYLQVSGYWVSSLFQLFQNP